MQSEANTSILGQRISATAEVITATLNALLTLVVESVTAKGVHVPQIRAFRGFPLSGAVVTQRKGKTDKPPAMYEVITPGEERGRLRANTSDNIVEVYINPYLSNPESVVLALYGAVITAVHPPKMIPAMRNGVARIENGREVLKKQERGKEWRQLAEMLGLGFMAKDGNPGAPFALYYDSKEAPGEAMSYRVQAHINTVKAQLGSCEFPQSDVKRLLAFERILEPGSEAAGRIPHRVFCPNGEKNEAGETLASNAHITIRAAEMYREAIVNGDFHKCHVCNSSLSMETDADAQARRDSKLAAGEAKAPQPESVATVKAAQGGRNRKKEAKAPKAKAEAE